METPRAIRGMSLRAKLIAIFIAIKVVPLVLLAVFARQQVPLVLYALAFAPPYLALTARSTPEAPRAAVAAGGEPS